MEPVKPKISVEYSKNATIITFEEEKILEDANIKAIETSIMSVVEQSSGINMILDFRNVQFLSSAVLGLLIKISKKIYEKKGQLRLCNIDSKIYEVFKITRLTKIFEIYENLDQAAKSFED
jgi:anti-sigma B factor antagonist